MLLELSHVSKHYDLASGEGRWPVLKDISLHVEAGEALAVIGPSGSGKSTLLNIIGALDRPTSGTVIFDGKNLADCGDKELARIRNREIGFVFQLHHLLPQCTVLENVLIPTLPQIREKNIKNKEDRGRELLKKVGLEKHLDHFPAQLSGGEMQRVAVVRSLINRPKLVLADEPTGSLDRQTAANLGRLLVDVNKEEGTTLMVVTHSFDLARLLDKAYEIRDGKLENVTIP
jgi:lipoprotein-releasing system ATP-binding protein